MGCTQTKNPTSPEDIAIKLETDIPFLVDGIINLTYECFDKISRDYYQVKRFEDINNYITRQVSDNLHVMQRQIKLHKKFKNILLLFNSLVQQQISTRDELCELFMFTFREKIRRNIIAQYSQYNLAVLNTLLHRFKDLYPEKESIPIAQVVS
jgi:hypothetical protein